MTPIHDGDPDTPMSASRSDAPGQEGTGSQTTSQGGSRSQTPSQEGSGIQTPSQEGSRSQTPSVGGGGEERSSDDEEISFNFDTVGKFGLFSDFPRKTE